jgi:hypothetical protein
MISTGFPVTHQFVRVILSDINQVCVASVDFLVLHDTVNSPQDIITIVKIIGIEKPDDVTGGNRTETIVSSMVSTLFSDTVTTDIFTGV